MLSYQSSLAACATGERDPEEAYKAAPGSPGEGWAWVKGHALNIGGTTFSYNTLHEQMRKKVKKLQDAWVDLVQAHNSHTGVVEEKKYSGNLAQEP
jgi:hypothetical protein